MKWSMWRATAVLVLGAACVAAIPRVAEAVQDEAAFAALRADLEHRRDNELATPSGKAAKKQRKAVLKCLKLLDKSSDKRSTDLKIATKCTALVRKPFADELVATGKLADLGDTLTQLGMTFRAAVEADLAAAQGEADALDPKSRKKLDKQTGKAQSSLDAIASAGSDFRLVFKRLGAAQKAVDGALKIADKGTLGGKAKPETLVMTVNGEAWKSRKDAVRIQTFDGDDGLSFSAIRDRPDGGDDEIQILIRPVPGKGRYAIADADRVEVRFIERPSGGPTVRYTLPTTPTGVLVVDEFAKSKPRFRLRFKVTVTHPTEGAVVITNGAGDFGLGNVFGSGGPLFF